MSTEPDAPPSEDDATQQEQAKDATSDDAAERAHVKRIAKNFLALLRDISDYCKKYPSTNSFAGTEREAAPEGEHKANDEQALKPRLPARGPWHKSPFYPGYLLGDICECDLDDMGDVAQLLSIRDNWHLLLEDHANSGRLSLDHIKMIQQILYRVMNALENADITTIRALHSATHVLLDPKTNTMEKRADVVLAIMSTMRIFPVNIENNPPSARCPNCSNVYTSESICPDCGAKIELPDPIEYFNKMRQGCATGLAWRLAEFEPEFKNLPAEFIVEYLSSGKEPTTIAAYFSCKVGAFGDRGKVWRDVSPVAKRYNDACRTESAKARFAKWREVRADVDKNFGPPKT